MSCNHGLTTLRHPFKVFFRAGVVAHIEDLRDARLSYLITVFQAQIRWHCAQVQN